MLCFVVTVARCLDMVRCLIHKIDTYLDYSFCLGVYLCYTCSYCLFAFKKRDFVGKSRGKIIVVVLLKCEKKNSTVLLSRSFLIGSSMYKIYCSSVRTFSTQMRKKELPDSFNGRACQTKVFQIGEWRGMLLPRADVWRLPLV